MRRLFQCLAVSILLVLPAHAQQRVDAEAEAAANNRQTTSPTAEDASRTFARAWVAFALTTSPDCATSERFYLALVQYIETHPGAYSNPRATMEDARTRRDATCDNERGRAAPVLPSERLLSPAKDAAPSLRFNTADLAAPEPLRFTPADLAPPSPPDPILAALDAAAPAATTLDMLPLQIREVPTAALRAAPPHTIDVPTAALTTSATPPFDPSRPFVVVTPSVAKDDVPPLSATEWLRLANLSVSQMSDEDFDAGMAVLCKAWAEYERDFAPYLTIDAATRPRPECDDEATQRERRAKDRALWVEQQDARVEASRARYEAAHARVEALKAEIAAEQAATAQQQRRAWLWAPSLVTTPPVVPLPRYGRDMLEIVGRVARPGSTMPPVVPLWSDIAAVPHTTRSLIAGAPPSLVGEDGTYLGTLSSNRYDPNSISNPYGRYGSRYSADSVNNPYGKYGSPYSPHSATNPYATQAPKIVNPYLGRLSANPYATDSTSNRYGPYGSPYSPSSIMNPYSPYGSLFSPSSVTNPYAISPLPPLAPLSGR